MRIALFSDTYPPQINGVATATYTLAKTLQDNGNDVLVVTVAKEGQKKITFVNRIIRIPGFTVKQLYNYKIANIFSMKAYRFIKSFDPEVIHVQTEIGIGIFGRIVAKRMNVPLVYTYHTMYEDYTYYVTKGFKPFDTIAKNMVGFLSALVGDSTTQFTTTSFKTKKALRRYGVKKYINIVPNGIDLSMFDDKKIDKEKGIAIRKKYGLENKFCVLILGRLAKEKANDIVIKWLTHYINDSDDKSIHLMVVGDGPDKQNLENLVKSLKMENYVTFIGTVEHSQVPIYYNLADLYVSASTSETQGLTFNEAMASKTMVIARYDDNLVETILDGKTGFFFRDESSFIATIKKIRNFSEEEKNKIVEQAYKNDLDKFSLNLYYERMMSVYVKAARKFW